MDKSKITQTVNDAEILFKTIMNLYWSYLDSLEKIIQRIPESETEILNDFYQHIQEVQNALDHDISVFQKALNSDMEDLHQIKDKLKIDDIYKKLNK